MAKAIFDASHQIHKCSLQFMKLIFPSKDYQITQTDSSKPLQNQQYLQESCSLHPKSSHTNGNCSSQQTDSFAKQSCIVHQNANHKNSECLVQSGMKNPNAQNVLDPILGTKEQLEFWGRCHRCGYPASELVRQMLLIEGWDTSEIPIHRGKNCPFYNKSDSLTTDKCNTCGWGFHLTCKNKGPKWVGPMKDFDNTNEYGSVLNISSALQTSKTSELFPTLPPPPLPPPPPPTPPPTPPSLPPSPSPPPCANTPSCSRRPPTLCMPPTLSSAPPRSWKPLRRM